jgi:3-hydroxybutyryl-CoA dehydrogenase
MPETTVPIQRITVVGAGLMGHGISQVFASAGFDVAITDANPAALPKAVEGIRTILELFRENQLITRDQAEDAVRRVRTEPDLQKALDGAQYVVEAVFEDIELKRKVFGDLDRLCPPDVILTSNTSGLSANDIAQGLARQERFCVTHFWNPPHFVPLVEVVRADRRSGTTISTAVDVLRKAGKVPVVVQKDVPGFVGNRLQYALFREAVALVEQGVVTAEDVDTVVEMSFGRRYPSVGPLKTADLNGTGLFATIASYLFRDLDCAQEPHKLLKDLVAGGNVGVKSGRGFFEWTPEMAAETIRRRDLQLIRFLQQDQAENT